MLEEQYLEYSERLEPQTRGQRHCWVLKEPHSQEGTIGLVEVETTDFCATEKSCLGATRRFGNTLEWNGRT